jgi:hypothetical protein
MRLLRLSELQSQSFDEQPEAAMGLHFAEAGGHLCLILSGRVLLIPGLEESDEKSRRVAEKSRSFADKLWFDRETPAISPQAESQLLMSLDSSSDRRCACGNLWISRIRAWLRPHRVRRCRALCLA